MAMAGLSPHNLLQGLGKQPGYSSVVTKNPPPLVPVDRTHTSGSGYHYHSHKKGKKKSIALSALTLLSFMVFLNLLHQCLEQQMEHYNTSSNSPQIIVVQQRLQEGREEAQKRKGEAVEGDLEEEVEGEHQGEYRTSMERHTKAKGKARARTTTPSTTSTTSKYTQIPVKLNTLGKYKYH